MILGNGVDIAEIDRIERALSAKHGERFRDRVYTPGEQEYCERRKKGRAQSYAARFAAKEATMKALGVGWGGRAGWLDIEVIRARGEPPRIALHGAAAKTAECLGMTSFSLSITHAAGLALAFVVVEGERRPVDPVRPSQMARVRDMGGLTSMGAAQLARCIRAGDASPLEVVDAHIERIQEVEPHLNAFITTTFDRARDHARRLTRDGLPAHARPLHGVPVTVKDAIAVSGLRFTAGSDFHRDDVAAEDAEAVCRLTAAGAIVLGKTSCPDMSGAVETRNPIIGQTCNPWDLERSPGGSSGGEGAIVGAGGSLLLWPVFPWSAPVHGFSLGAKGSPAYTSVFNGLGFPAAAFPVGFDAHGLPLSVQIIARPGEDEVALVAATVLEEELGGARIAPVPTQRRSAELR